MDKIIIGNGGWAKEVSALTGIKKFYVSDGFEGKHFLAEIKNPCKAIIAIAFPLYREQIFKEYDFEYIRCVHRSCIIYDSVLPDDIFVAPNCTITTNVYIGKQCQLNIGTILGHSVVIGDFFTTAPNVFIGGNTVIGDRVYIGAGALIKEKINICSDVIIGMGSVVVKDITEPGTYVGNPVRKIK